MTRFRRLSGAALLLSALLPFLGCSQTDYARPFTFVQLCDPQLGFGGYDSDLLRLEQAVRQIDAMQPKPDFVVVCGDLVHAPGTDDEWARQYGDVKRALSELTVPCYIVPGNHDVGKAPTAEALQRYRKYVGKDYYAFDHKGCTFVMADSQLWMKNVPRESDAQDRFVRQAVKSAHDKGLKVFVVQHIPLFVRSPDEPAQSSSLPPEIRKDLLEFYRENGVVAILSGHLHDHLDWQYNSIQMVTGEATSVMNKGRPRGFRVWHVSGAPPFRNEFVALVNRYEPAAAHK